MKKDLDIFYSKISHLCLNENMEKTRKKSYAKSSGENHDFSSHKSGISSCIFPIFHLTFKNWIFLKCISCAHLDCYLLTRGEQANKSLDTILSTESGLSIYEVAFEFPFFVRVVTVLQYFGFRELRILGVCGFLWVFKAPVVLKVCKFLKSILWFF